MKKQQILELLNMKLSKTIDQTRICKKNYNDPLGYFCMGLFFFTCPDVQVTNKFHLSNGRFHLSRTNVIVEACIKLVFQLFVCSPLSMQR